MIAPIRTEKNSVIWKQSTFDPFKYNSLYGRGDVWKYTMDCDGKDLPPAVSIVSDEEKRFLTVFVSVRSEEKLDLSLAFENFPNLKFIEALTEHNENLSLVNTPGHEELTAVELSGVETDGRGLHGIFPAYSWNMIRFSY